MQDKRELTRIFRPGKVAFRPQIACFKGCASKRTVVSLPSRVRMPQTKLLVIVMATKESKRQVRGLIEGLEQRVHCGPAIQDAEIQTARDFLCRNEFSPASDYFNRLAHIENRLQARPREISWPQAKRNYGGMAGGCQMQVQSIYDHLILSTCYEGDFNNKHGRVKISHRFNQEGRIDFVELKFLRSLHPPLNGELRKLLAVQDYSSIRKDWFETRASVLRILPQELIFLFADLFRVQKAQLLAWLLNIGHGIVEDLLKDLKSQANQYARPRFDCTADHEPDLDWLPKRWDPAAVDPATGNGNGKTALCVAAVSSSSQPRFSVLENGHAAGGVAEWNGNGSDGRSMRPAGNPGQLRLDALLRDKVALPILEKAAHLETVVEVENPTEVLVRYLRKIR